MNANAGRQWRPVRQAPRVQGHDFPHPDVPRAYPYGIYDVGRNAGFVNVGMDHDTGAFPAASIRGWWRAKAPLYWRSGPPTPQPPMRRKHAPRPPLAEMAAGRSSPTRRAGRWPVRHFPPGTSKWNKVEHIQTLLVHLLELAGSEPLRDDETIVDSIARTTTCKAGRSPVVWIAANTPPGAGSAMIYMKRINPRNATALHGD